MRSRNSKPTEGVPLTSTASAWVGWLFFLIGVCYLIPVYVTGLRPQKNADGWHFFERPDDIDLWVGTAIVVVVFSGAGAAILSHNSLLNSRRLNERQKAAHPDAPWMWRLDWATKEIQAERPARKTIYVVWAVLCLLSGLPGLEFWNDGGRGWPDHLVSYLGCGAVVTGGLALVFLLKAMWRTASTPRSHLHLRTETGVLGGPLEGAIEYPATSRNPEYLVRLVCEKHWFSEHEGSEGGTVRSHEITPVYEDTYRSSAENGLIPVRFGIPINESGTTTDWLTPVYLWFVELEDLHRKALARFFVPVFKTEASDSLFELGDAAADRFITEETPQQCLRRHGITITVETSGVAPERTTILVPAGRSVPMAIGLIMVALICLAVPGVVLPKLISGQMGFNTISGTIVAVCSLFGGLLVFVVGLFGLLMTGCAIQLLFERRRIEFDSREIRVRHSYFGPGWTTRIHRDAVKRIQITHSGSFGQRQFKNVVAVTEGMLRRDGTMMERRRSIVNTVPPDAAEAVKTFIESVATQ